MARELYPYRQLIKMGLLPTIMTAHTIYPAVEPDVPATLSKKMITGILRDELQFEGVIITDSMPMAGIITRYDLAEACAMAIVAGCDIAMMRMEHDETRHKTFAAIKRYFDQGKLTEERINESVARILTLKEQFGLFDREIQPASADEAINKYLDSSIANDVSRSCVIEARDRNKRLPLKHGEKVVVVEQQTPLQTDANDFYCHPNWLMESVARYTKNIRYQEVSMYPKPEQRAAVSTLLDYSDTVIITSFYGRAWLPNKELIEELVNKGKKAIVITNTPYEIAVPASAQTVVVNFGCTPAGIDAAVDLIFGEIKQTGKWPISYKPE